MDRDEDISALQNLKAYRVFLEETGQHILKARNLINKNKDVGLSVADLNELGRAFHTIKGGAGFFKLKEIELLAGELELYFGGAGGQGQEVGKPEVESLLQPLERQLNELIAAGHDS